MTMVRRSGSLALLVKQAGVIRRDLGRKLSSCFERCAFIRRERENAVELRQILEAVSECQRQSFQSRTETPGKYRRRKADGRALTGIRVGTRSRPRVSQRVPIRNWAQACPSEPDAAVSNQPQAVRAHE